MPVPAPLPRPGCGVSVSPAPITACHHVIMSSPGTPSPGQCRASPGLRIMERGMCSGIINHGPPLALATGWCRVKLSKHCPSQQRYVEPEPGAAPRRGHKWLSKSYTHTVTHSMVMKAPGFLTSNHAQIFRGDSSDHP